MAQLAIKGHQTRGKEVIELLEMLGGNNPDKNTANCDFLGFFIGKETRNIYATHLPRFDSEKVIIYTLEEFLKKFPYKVGDKVSSKYLKNYKIEKMEWEDTNNRVIYKLQGMGWYNTSELQPYKEEAMDKVNKAIFDTNAQCCDISNRLIKEETMEEKLCIGLFPVGNGRKEIIPCDGYEVVSDEGKFYVVKKPPKYPKTYGECCRIVNANPLIGLTYDNGHKYSYDADNLRCYGNIRKLLIRRDAYWKIAGEQMGLGKPWEPDWEENDGGYRYCIHNRSNKIVLSNEWLGENYILSFPTEEMRDAFYENFKSLIEQCKELL